MDKIDINKEDIYQLKSFKICYKEFANAQSISKVVKVKKQENK